MTDSSATKECRRSSTATFFRICLDTTESSAGTGVMHQIFNYIASNGYCTVTEIKDNDKTQAAQLIRAFGGKDSANEALSSLSQFIIYRKIA